MGSMFFSYYTNSLEHFRRKIVNAIAESATLWKPLPPKNKR